jgi:hypothetical protein
MLTAADHTGRNVWRRVPLKVPKNNVIGSLLGSKSVHIVLRSLLNSKSDIAIAYLRGAER